MSPIVARYIDSLRPACQESSKYRVGKAVTESAAKSESSNEQQDHATCKDGVCMVSWKPSKQSV
jgi:hypothetical protein